MKTQVEASDVIPDFGETIQSLSGEQKTLQTKLSELNQDFRAAKAFLFNQTDFTKEASEQRLSDSRPKSRPNYMTTDNQGVSRHGN